MKKREFYHMIIRKQTARGVCFMNERQPNSLGCCAGCGLPLKASERISELLVVVVVHSKGGRLKILMLASL